MSFGLRQAFSAVTTDATIVGDGRCNQLLSFGDNAEQMLKLATTPV